MTAEEIIGYIASVAVGLILGMLGGGGSILCIPILVYLFKLDAVTASAYSLFIVGITSVVGAVPKYRDHLVDIKTGLTFGIPSIITIFTTRKWIVPSIPDIIFTFDSIVITKRILLLGLFAVLMILASYAMIKGRKPMDSDASFNPVLIMIQGVLIGFLTGLVGAGGGFLIIPALVLLTGLRFKIAVGTSLFIIAINSLMGFLGDVLNYQINWPFLVSITFLSIAGITVGNRIAHRFDGDFLRKSFGWLTLFMGIWILVKELLLSDF